MNKCMYCIYWINKKEWLHHLTWKVCEKGNTVKKDTMGCVRFKKMESRLVQRR